MGEPRDIEDGGYMIRVTRQDGYVDIQRLSLVDGHWLVDPDAGLSVWNETIPDLIKELQAADEESRDE